MLVLAQIIKQVTDSEQEGPLPVKDRRAEVDVHRMDGTGLEKPVCVEHEGAALGNGLGMLVCRRRKSRLRERTGDACVPNTEELISGTDWKGSRVEDGRADFGNGLGGIVR